MSNILSRRRKIEDLTSALVDLKNQYHDHMKSVDQKKTTLEILVKEYSDISSRLGNNKIRIAEASGQLTAVETEKKRVLEEKEKISNEQHTINEQVDIANERIENKLLAIDEHEKNHNRLTEDLSTESDSMKSMTAEIGVFQEKITKIQVEMAAVEEKLIHAASNINRVIEEKAGVLEKERLDVSSLKTIDEQERTFDETLKHLGERIAEESKFKVIYDEKRTAIEDEKSKATEALQIKQKEIEGHSKDVLVVKETLHKGEVNMAKYEVEKDNIIREIWEKYELSIIEALKFKSDQHKDDMKEIRSIKRELKEIGDVNLGAIEEYADVKERYDFLSEQKEDLLQAQKFEEGYS